MAGVFFHHVTLGVENASDFKTHGRPAVRQRDAAGGIGRSGGVSLRFEDLAARARLRLATLNAGVRRAEGAGTERIVASHRRAGGHARRVDRSLFVTLQRCGLKREI